MQSLANGIVQEKITPVENRTVIRVFYATDRQQVRERNGKLCYRGDRSQQGLLHYGVCSISIPKIHHVGRLESPSLLKLEFRPDPRRHIIIDEVCSLAEEAFLGQIAASVKTSQEQEAIIFVHGYNVTFSQAAKRTGQLAFDLNFAGAPILYSWPSRGKIEGYFVDETNIAWTASHFQRFLHLVATRSGANRVHIIAHSMGNRAVCEALKTISAELDGQFRIDHLVLAAPDIDTDTFRELVESASSLFRVGRRG